MAEARASGVFEQGARPLGIRAWAMYDFANSGYTTVVLSAIFNAYFVAVVAGNAPWVTFVITGAFFEVGLLILHGVDARRGRRVALKKA
jgi:MFS transporter, UMF1 family